MRRMISDKSIKTIEELGEHVAVENGNVQVGKDLEVDGVLFADGKDINIGEKQYALGVRNGVFYDFNNNIAFGRWDNFSDVGCYVSFTKAGDVIISFYDTDVDSHTLQLNARDVYTSIKTKYFRHSLTLTCETDVKFYIDYYSKNNLKVDSLQDLSTITGNLPFGCGTAQATYTSNVWKIGETAITAVKDNVQTVTK